MNKSEFITALTEKTGLTKKDIAAVVDAYHETIVENVAKGDKISFVGFGSFEVRERAEKTGRNPATGEAMVIPASKAMTFKMSKNLKEKL